MTDQQTTNPTVLYLTIEAVLQRDCPAIIGNPERVMGTRLQAVKASVPRWLFDPVEDDFWQIIKLRPDLSLIEVQKFVETAEFGLLAQAFLRDTLCRLLRTCDADNIRLVVFADDGSVDTQRRVVYVLSKTFPGSAVCDISGNTYPPPEDWEVVIEKLEFGVRTYNCLKRMGVCTVFDLLMMCEQDLRDAPNFGEKSIEEVKEELWRRGLSLRPD